MGRRLAALTLGLLVILGLVALRVADPYPVQVARETSFDVFQQWRPRQAPPDLPVRIIDIDETSLAEVGQWPWPRETLARLSDRLTELGAAAIAFDILFSEGERTSGGPNPDEAFAASLKSGPTILGLAQNGSALPVTTPAKAGLAATGSDPLAAVPELGGAAQPLAILAQAASGLGVASLDRQGAGVARRLPLLWRVDSGAIPTLSVEALRVATGAPTLVVMGDNVDGRTVDAVRVGDIAIPTGPTGDLRLYYRELPPETYIPATDVLDDSYASLGPLVSGHIVLIGSSASGLNDIRISPLGVPVPGVSIHLQALEQILTQTFLDRADWVSGLELLLLAASCLVIVLAVIVSGPLVGLGVSLAVAAASVSFSWWSFSSPGLLVDPSYPLFAALVSYASMAFLRFAVTDLDRRRIRRAFGYYVEPSVLTQIEADQSLLRLGGNVRELTVMFSDVRNFSALAERTTPEQLVNILNGLFGALGEAILRHRGTIDKFMGDSVMAFWNAPAEEKEHALLAGRAALAMRAALRDLNRGSDDPIHIGIGIATGPALVGNMGFEKRFDYSCVGDTVNVASRIEGACKSVGYSILVTSQMAAEAHNLASLEAGWVELKGMSGREQVHLLVGDERVKDSAAFTELAATHAELIESLFSDAPDPALLQKCEVLAAAVDIELVQFYASLPSRLADFPAVDVAKDVA
ncbi:MAG: CHASE2 domain-containing protein [Devosia sp.]